MAKQLFENLKFLVLSSPELEDDVLDVVKSKLNEHKAVFDLKSIHDNITEEDFIKAEYTHVVSNTVYFKLYNFTQENLIPVVTTEFIFTALEKKSQPGIRPFSPDPRNVLKKIHVCVGGLSDSDKEAIYGGVRALGGSYSETLNRFVTHLISNNPDDDCCMAVRSVVGNPIDIKVVTPHWIDDCLKTRKKLDETPYLLDLDSPKERAIQNHKELDVLSKNYDQVRAHGKFLKDKVFYIGSDLGLSRKYVDLINSLITSSGGKVSNSFEEAKYYVGKYREGDEYITASKNGYHVGNIHWIFWMIEYQKWASPFEKLLHYPFVRGGIPEMKNYVISSTNYSGDARYYIMKLAEAMGAKFTPSLTQENTHLIAATAKGRKYSYSLKWNIKIVNHLWLEETYQKWRVQPDNHPRYSHYPRSIALNDIIGGAALDMEVLKKFYETGHSDVTTNIIEDSENDEASSLQRTINVIPEEDRQEIEPEAQVPLISNQQEDTSLLHAELPQDQISIINQSTKLPSLGGHETEELESTDSGAKSSTGDKSVTPKKKMQKGEAENLELKSQSLTVATSTRALSDIDNNVKNASLRMGSGRKAKDKAAAKLHEDMEELNYFQKQHKSKDIPLLPHEIEEKKRRRESEQLEKEAKANKSTDSTNHTNKNDGIEENPKPKKKSKQNQSSSVYDINAIATGWEIGFSKSELAILGNLGIHINKEFKRDVNAIISPKFMRTEKFLIGLSYRLEYIVSPLLLKDILESFKTNPTDLSRLPDVSSYSLDQTNKKSVKELTDLPIRTLLRRCQERIDSNNKIFKGLTFNITPKVPGGIPTITKILKAHGADSIHVLKAIKDLKDIRSLKKSARKDIQVIFLGSEKGFIERVTELLQNGDKKGKIVEWNWVIQSIFHMDIEHGKNVIFET